MAVDEVINGLTAWAFDMKAGEQTGNGQQTLALPATQRLFMLFFGHYTSFYKRNKRCYSIRQSQPEKYRKLSSVHKGKRPQGALAGFGLNERNKKNER